MALTMLRTSFACPPKPCKAHNTAPCTTASTTVNSNRVKIQNIQSQQQHACIRARVRTYAKRAAEEASHEVLDAMVANAIKELDSMMPPLPRPGRYQQTLKKSFTLAGIGIHTGQYAYVRVRPAHAGEGRYFVQVPEGTNNKRFKMQEDPMVDINEPADPDMEFEKEKAQAYADYLDAVESYNYPGSFQEFFEFAMLKDRYKLNPNIIRELNAVPEDDLQDSTIEQRPEIFVQASVSNMVDFEADLNTNLGNEHMLVRSVELLLAALEACGVDNARIEIEGGDEIPIIDGTALPWVLEVQNAGITDAFPLGSSQPVEKLNPCPTEPITVYEGESYITLIPNDSMTISYGIDESQTAPVVGKQWYSWNLYDDDHFRYEIAPARNYATSAEWVVELQSLGFLRGGTEAVVLLADNSKWVHEDMVRFARDEGARHGIARLVGNLALVGQDGNGGVPLGHVVAFQPTADLHMRFLDALQDACTPEKYAPAIRYDFDESMLQPQGEGEEEE